MKVGKPQKHLKRLKNIDIRGLTSKTKDARVLQKQICWSLMLPSGIDRQSFVEQCTYLWNLQTAFCCTTYSLLRLTNKILSSPEEMLVLRLLDLKDESGKILVTQLFIVLKVRFRLAKVL